MSLCDHGVGTYFSEPFDMLTPNSIWTSTPDASDPNLQVTIGVGTVYPLDPDPPKMRPPLVSTVCVAGELGVGTFALSPVGDTAWDSRTHLMWEQGPGADVESWAEALARCDDSTLAGFDDWRLPTAKEFSTIVDDAKLEEPFIREPLAVGGARHYWSATPVPSDETQVYVHLFLGLGGYALPVTGWVGGAPAPGRPPRPPGGGGFPAPPTPAP
jgi:hypothetical protein